MRVGGRQRGASYLLTLFMVAAMGFGLAHFGTLWSTAARKERETELLFVGGEFARALASYRSAVPGETVPGPRRLEELLEDPRFPFPRRHLRRLYRDPVTGAADWVLERREGYIVGLRSRSAAPALKSAGLPPWVVAPAGPLLHRDWLFQPVTP